MHKINTSYKDIRKVINIYLPLLVDVRFKNLINFFLEIFNKIINLKIKFKIQIFFQKVARVVY